MNGYANEVDEYVSINVMRHLICKSGVDDPLPDEPWSKPFNESVFLLALQKVQPDEWNKSCNERVWTHLHIGGNEPN